MDYFQLGGLVTKENPTTENNNLFYAQYLASGGENVYNYNEVMASRRTSNGLYLRSPHHTKRSVSHDEITAYMAISKMLKLNYHHEIWNQLKANYGAYPAIIEKWYDYLPFNPANYYAWGEYAGSKWSKIFFPLYFINMTIALSKDKQQTSSKLIYWLELNTMPSTTLNRFLKDFFNSKMTSQYGADYLKKMRMIYFNQEDEDFPLFKEVEQDAKMDNRAL